MIPKLSPLRDRKHLNTFPERLCIARTASPCHGDVVAAHVRIGWYSLGMKPPDDWTLPLCDKHHRQQHSIPEVQFWQWVFNESPQALGEVLRLAGQAIYGGQE